MTQVRPPSSVRFTTIFNDDVTQIYAVTTSECHGHAHPHADNDDDDKKTDNRRIQRLAWFLEAHFGEVELHMPEESHVMSEERTHERQGPSLVVRLDEDHATIDLVSMVSLYPLKNHRIASDRNPCRLFRALKQPWLNEWKVFWTWL